MADVARDEIETSLQKKGFSLREGDHRFYTLMVDGKKTSVRTKISTGSSYKTYGDSLLSAMCHQLGLTKAELLDLINCPLSYDEYVKKLKERKTIA